MHRFPVLRSRARRCLAAAAALAATAGLLIAAPQLAAAKPPPNPTNGQLNAAKSAKEQLAGKVGSLSGQIAQAKVQLQQLQAAAELAEQKFADSWSKWQRAKADATKAQATVKTAQQNVDKAHEKFVAYIQATYMSGDVGGTAGSLLTATDPSQLLEQSTLEQYQQQHQADAIGGLQRATIAKSNADAKARQAAQATKKAAAKAKTEQTDAEDAFRAEQQQQTALQKSMASSQRELDSAQEQLATLNNQRSAYLAYKARQAQIAAEKRRQAELARERALQNSGGGGGGGGSSGFHSGPPAPSGGSWTAAKGKRAAQRAESQLGVMYAWAGGNANGPTRGVCSPGNGAPNDCNVIGYDCSGLAMYAWGQWWDHFAATQYSQAGRYHPSLSNLKPGDLLFWSDGGVGAIHHVAIYIGGGEIVQAPNSGERVEISSMYDPGPIFGATRPLS